MKKKGSFMMTIGLLLLAAALVLTGYNVWEAKRAEKFSSVALDAMIEHIEQNTSEQMGIPDYMLFPEKEMPTVLIDDLYYIGILQIPELDLNLPILDSEWSYPKLQKAPCRYIGSIYKNDMVIAGHNIWSHFSPIKKLEVGSEVQFIDAEGNVFNYTVGWVEILQPTDVEELTDSKDWDLTLFTCTYSGSERYTVRCIREP